MKTIFKYNIPITDEADIIMPRNARILSVAQGGQFALSVWALVDTDMPRTSRKFYVYGTGNPAPHADTQIYVGTVPMSNGFVWHLFME